MGAALLERRGNGFVVDVSSLQVLPMRPGFARFGGLMCLSSGLDAVEGLTLWGNTYLPGDDAWEGAFYIFRVTVGTRLIAFPHTAYCHFLDAGFTATVSREMPSDHPWCRVLAPFTVATLNVNFGAKNMIIAPGGMVSRFTGATQWTVEEIFRIAVKEWRLEKFTDELKRKGVDNLTQEEYGYGHWGKQLFSIFETFAEEYINHYWRDDAMVAADSGLQYFFEQYSGLFPKICLRPPPSSVSTKAELVTFLSHLIWVVTAVHEHTGNIADHLHQFDEYHTHAKDGDLKDLTSLLPCTSSRLAVLFSRALTSRPGAKLYQSDVTVFSRFFREDCDPGISERFMSALSKLHDDLQEHNQASHYTDSKLYVFDPYELEVAVTV
jgi:hypothetical protein